MLLMTARSSGNILRLIFLLLTLSGVGSYAFSQTVINGNIKNIRGANKYPHTAVTAILAANKMTVSNPAGFIPGDTVLVIQMQGVGIYTTPYGQYGTKFGEPGLWEFLIISSVVGNDITFLNNLKWPYDIKGNIQIVNVPAFPNATVGGLSDLTCDPWDPVTKSGGVLAIIVGNTLKLQRNIDVSALGFKGGVGDLGDGICQITNASYQQDSYADLYTNAGWKGEGIAIHTLGGALLLPANAKGQGFNFTGGGGGNGRYSGGGGGSHRGLGGTGGNENNACATPLSGGLGGIRAEYNPDLLNRIFMGGGGGASTRSATGIAGSGGNGGGIVIVIANTIVGDGGQILAKGGNGGNGGGTGASGAGGGGAGGTIALSVSNYSGSAFDVNVAGGNGGGNPTPRLYGEGGGGGAGLVWLAVDNALISTKLTGGLAGISDNQQASDGTAGEKRPGFNPNLNGFLFNSIRSSVTQMPLDTSCSNMKPPKILGTLPVGGTAPFMVTWERSKDNFTTSNVVATGAALWDYTPVLDDTLKRSGPIYFRRTITDSSIPTQLIDISLPVVIEIQPSIKRNYVGPPDTICFAQNPPTVGQLPSTSLAYGSGTYTFKWMVSTVNGTSGFTTPASNTGPSYTPPPALTLDSWYRRTVFSGRCTDSSGVVKIKVLKKITGNNITSSSVQEICNGSSFIQVAATVAPALKEGDYNYRYKWISSTNSWGAAPDVSTDSVYNPVASSFPLGTMVSLRRVVFSGSHDVCKDTTSVATAVKLTRWPVIINNNITADQTIGYDSIPKLLKENTVPGMTGGAGAGTYIYLWQKDTLSWAAAPGTVNLTSYQPPALKVTTAFRRFVISSACSNISNTITITVHKKITNTIALANAVKDTIATGTGPGQLTGSVPTGGSDVPGDYSYKWYMSVTGTFVPGDVIAGAASQSYDPGTLTASVTVRTYYFRRDVSSPVSNPTSTYKSNIIKVVVLPVLATYNINGSAPKCAGSRPDWLKGSSPVTGGDGKYKYTWQDSTSGHNFADIPGFVKCDSMNYKPPVLTSGAAYRRIVYSGKNYTLLNATSNIVRVKIDVTVPPVVFNPASKISYNIDRIDTLPTIQLTVGTGVWDPASKVKDGNIAYNLALGDNVFTYKVTNGTCSNAGQYTIEVVEIKIPKGFSPNNGDDINNLFEITGVDLEAMNVTLKIINSAGSEVFSATNDNWSFWDGTKNGVDAPEGTYYYLFTMVSKRNATRGDWKGYLILKRKSYQ
jgi:gliding motility-associated-like protein